jgi:hypothetical protein
VAKVGTSKADGTISQQAAVHPWLAADAHGNKKKDVDIFLSGTSQKRLFDSEMWLCRTVRTTTDIL